jgi:hypothetical protein
VHSFDPRSHPKQRIARDPDWVCLISALEAKEWEDYGREPECKDHRHIPYAEAKDMVNPQWMKTATDHYNPIARVAGRIGKCIAVVMIEAYEWRTVRKSGGWLRLTGKQLLPGAPVDPRRRRIPTEGRRVAPKLNISRI